MSEKVDGWVEVSRRNSSSVRMDVSEVGGWGGWEGVRPMRRGWGRGERSGMDGGVGEAGVEVEGLRLVGRLQGFLGAVEGVVQTMRSAGGGGGWEGGGGTWDAHGYGEVVGDLLRAGRDADRRGGGKETCSEGRWKVGGIPAVW